MSGHGHGGSFPGGGADPLWATDPVRGSVLDFVTVDYVPIASLAATYTQLSWAAWVRPVTTNRQTAMGRLTVQDAAYIWIIEPGHVSGGWAVDLYDDVLGRQFEFSLIDPVINTWYHVAVTFDAATNLIMYINGIPIMTRAVTIGNVALTASFAIGRSTDDEWEGQIGDARFAEGVWTPADIGHQLAYPWELYRTPGMALAQAISGLAYPIFPAQGIHSAVFGGQVVGS